MNYLQAVILGLVQGIAEFFPVSSSGHLVIFRDLFGISEIPLLFDIILHLATLLAVLIVFRTRIAGILNSFWRLLFRRNDQTDAENLSIIVPLLLATVVTAVIGFSIEKFLPPEGARIASAELIITAFVLLGTAFLGKGTKGFGEISPVRGLFIGIAQGLGVFSGISRSGMTIAAGMTAGLKREVAAEFSFILSIPAILGAFILTLKDASTVAESIQAGPLAVSFIVSFVSGLFALTTLVKIVKHGKLSWFSAYLIPVGILGLFVL